MPAAKAAPLADTVSVLGVEPLVGITDNHGPPEAVVAAAVKVKLAPLLETERVWAAGAAPPTVCAKESELDETASVAVGVMLRVTATVWGLLAALAAVMTMAPVNVPTGSPVGTARAVRLVGVVPAAILATSQPPPEFVGVATVKLNEVPSVL